MKFFETLRKNLRLKKAQQLLDQFDLKKAETTLNNLLKEYPTDSSVLLNLAILHFFNNELEPSLQILSELNVKEKENPFVKLLLSELFFKMGDIESAEKQACELLSSDPFNPRLLLLLGKIYIFKGEELKAETFLDRLNTIDPEVLKVNQFLNNEMAHRKNKS